MRSTVMALALATLTSASVAAQPRLEESRRPRPIDGRGDGRSDLEVESSFDFGPWFRFRYAPDQERGTFRSAISRMSCGSCRYGRCNDREWDQVQRCQDRTRELEKKEAEWRRDAEHRRDEFARDMAEREREFRRREMERYRRHEREMAERWRELERRR